MNNRYARGIGKLMLVAMTGAAAMVTLPTRAATAQPAKNQQIDDAKRFFGEGEKAYNLGKFKEAVDLFTKAYEAWPNPAFLFNIAQSYRQQNDCKMALFFYKRFLSLKVNDKEKPLSPQIKAEVEGRIKELEDCVIVRPPPDGTRNPDLDGDGKVDPDGKTDPTKTDPTKTDPTKTDPTRVATDEDITDDDDEDRPGIRGDMIGAPTLVSMRGSLGASWLLAGDTSKPALFSGAVSAGYPLQVNEKLGVELGGALTFTRVPFKTSTMESASGYLFGLMANGAATYAVAPQIGVRADLGLGIAVFSGLTTGSPYLPPGKTSDGALGMFVARLAVTGEYELAPNFLLGVTPAFAFSPAKSGMAEGIDSLVRIDAMFTAGYRM